MWSVKRGKQRAPRLCDWPDGLIGQLDALHPTVISNSGGCFASFFFEKFDVDNLG